MLYPIRSIAIEWEVGGLNIGRKNASLGELKHLRGRLTTLEIHIPIVKMSKGLLPPQLKRYKISIDDSDWISPPNNSRALKVKLNTNDKADEVILQLKGIKQLELVADGSDDFTGSKQSVSLDALFSLESLSLEDLNLEKICNVPLSAGSFRQLRTITMHNCHKLTNIFSFSIDRVLPNLQAIEVSCCENMEEIFAIEREDDVNNTQLIHEIEFSQLCSVTLRRLPQLKSVCHRVKTTSQMQLTSSTNDGDIISEDIIDIPKSLFNEKVVFPNLETLKISSISAERIWHNQLPTMSSSFQNLNRLLVHNCDNLKELFPSSMVNGFVQLQYIQIYECSRLEEMVFMEELRAEEKKDIQFPFLKEMKITSCPNFKTFISDDKIGFPSLKAMDIQGCPKFKEFIFNDKVAVLNLEKLEISFMDNLEKKWHDQLVKDSFCKLKSLKVGYCEKLLNVFPSNIDGRLLSSLESLEVSECDSLEEIFDLRELSNYDSQILMLSFANLQKLRVYGCPKFKEFIFNDKVAVPNLEKLEIFYMDNLEKIWHNQIVKDSFCKLKSLEVKCCRRLLNVFPSNIHGRLLSSLESLEVDECDSLEEIFDLGELSNYDSQILILPLANLQKLSVSWCESLKNLFSGSVLAKEGVVMEEAPARFLFPKLTSLELSCLPQLRSFYLVRHTVEGSVLKLLQRLEVSWCQSLKNPFSVSILANEGVVMEEAPARFLFPKLTSLVLYFLPELRSFYPGRHKVEGPVLKKLKLFVCGIHDNDEEGQMQQPFFLSLVEEAFPCLEELILSGNNVTMLWQAQFPESLFDGLKILQVWYDKSPVLPLGIIQRCQNLEKLSLIGCPYDEIFPHGEDQTRTKIKTLEGCDSLINLMPPPTSFQNLTSLEVSHCKSLINVGTSSVAKSLVQLTEMSIISCEKITVVIGNHGDEIEDEIIFRKLKSLMLEDLPSLTSFCSWNLTLKFPSLETLTVHDCRSMKIFSQGDLTTQMLQKVNVNHKSVELCSDFNVNTAIQQSYDKVNALRMPISAKDDGASSSHHLE